LCRQRALDGPALIVMRVQERESVAAIGCANRVVDVKYLGYSIDRARAVH
jgi:hypothetical protein